MRDPAPSNSKPGASGNVVIRSKRYLFTRDTRYARVFISRGMLEPGRDRTFYGGVAFDF